MFLLSVTLMATGCGESGAAPPTAPPEPPRPTQVAVQPAESRLIALGATVQLIPEVRDQNGHVMSGTAVAWTSSDAVVASVDRSGLVTAVDNGSATITASAAGATGTATVTVEQEVAALALGAEVLAFRALGDTLRLAAGAVDANDHSVEAARTADVEWASSDATVAHVDAAGLVTAVGNGSATITAALGGAMGVATATVEQEATTLTLGPEALAFRALGDTLRLVAEAADANGYSMEVEWTSSEAAVAHVDASGLVTAVGNGSATVAATAGAAVRSAAVVVAQVAVVFEMSPEAAKFRALGDTLRLLVEAADANGHAIESLEWASNNAAVAAVDSSGLVAAVGNGSARITATASGATGSATITVEQEAVALGGLPAADTLLWYGEPGDTLRLVVTAAVDGNGYPVEGVLAESAPVEWSTSLSGVATVDDDGLVKGSGEGAATITATAADLGLSTSTELTVINRDRAVLVAFYHATGGSDWRCPVSWTTCYENWTTQAPMDTWTGVGTSVRADGVVMVTGLHFRSRLTGSLPPELGNLANLRSLWLYDNQLTGPIPSELGNLTSLEYLSLGWNQLMGAIPPELGNLTSLEYLYLGSGEDQLMGAIPPELGNLANLKTLNLWGHQLTSPIPPELASLANLEWLQLGGDQLTGPIPPWLGNLANLRSLSLGGSQLTGPIPPELASLANLEWLGLGGDQLTGPVPPWLGSLANLRSLSLGGNFTGPIPPELGNLTNLRWLHLPENQLTGPIPPELGNLAGLQRLQLNDNQLTGPIPPELGNLSNVDYMNLGNNQLTGSIPSELSRLNLVYGRHGYLLLNDNQLTGRIPPELGSFNWLRRLDLSGNQISGPIPDELGNATNLRHLLLHGNATLSGRLPETLTRLGLYTFYWNDTQLCHPPTNAFRQWFQYIRDHQGGPPCGS